MNIHGGLVVIKQSVVLFSVNYLVQFSLWYDFSLNEGIIFIRPSIYILISVIFSAIRVVNLSSCI